jgi:hypothetical protein
MPLYKKILNFIMLMGIAQQLIGMPQTVSNIVLDPIHFVAPDMLVGIKNLGALSLGKAWIGSWFGGGDPNELLAKFFEVLRAVDPRKPPAEIYYQNLEAPYLLYLFLIGEITPKQALSIFNDQIKNKKNRRGFSRKLLKRCAEMTFDPEKSANVMKTVSGIGDLLKELRSRGYTIHLIGNWNNLIFEYIAKKHPVVNNINGKKIISGNLKIAKGSAMFKKFFEDNGINPEETIILEPYTSVANELRSTYPGIMIIHATDLKEAKKALKQYGIVP